MSVLSEKSARIDQLSVSILQSERETAQIRRNNSRRFGYSPNSIDYNIYAPLTGSRRDISAGKSRTRRMCKSIEIDTRNFHHTFNLNPDHQEKSSEAKKEKITFDSNRTFTKDANFQYSPYGTPSSMVDIQQGLQDQNNAFGIHLFHSKQQNVTSVNTFRPQSTQVSQYRETPSRIPIADLNPVQTQTESRQPGGRVHHNFLSHAMSTPPGGRIHTSFSSPSPSVQVAMSLRQDIEYPTASSVMISPRPTGAAVDQPHSYRIEEQVSQEVSQLRDRLNTAAQQNEKLKELNKLLLRKLVHLHRAVKIAQ